MTRPDNSAADQDAHTTSRNRFGFLHRSSSQKNRTVSSTNGASSNEDKAENTKTLPKGGSKFGKLLRRSMSVMSSSSLPRKPIVAQKSLSADAKACSAAVTHEESSCSSIEDYIQEVNTVSLSESDDDETEDITNAFAMFNSSSKPQKSATLLHNTVSREPSFSPPTGEKTTVKSVKVSRVHSQKSPHIRYAASKLVSGDHMDLRSSTLLRKKESQRSTPSQEVAARRRSSCPDINNPTNSTQGMDITYMLSSLYWDSAFRFLSVTFCKSETLA